MTSFGYIIPCPFTLLHLLPTVLLSVTSLEQQETNILLGIQPTRNSKNLILCTTKDIIPSQNSRNVLLSITYSEQKKRSARYQQKYFTSYSRNSLLQIVRTSPLRKILLGNSLLKNILLRNCLLRNSLPGIAEIVYSV